MGSKEAYMKWKAEKAAEKDAEEKQETKRKVAEAPRPTEKKVAAEKRDQKTAVRSNAAEQKRIQPRGLRTASPVSEQRLPPLPRPPSELARWQERDFFLAKLQEKPELLEVIARSAVEGRDDEAIVQILTRLLQPEMYAGLRELVVGDDTGSGRTTTRRRTTGRRNRADTSYSRKLIEASVDALAQNTTPAANRTLAQLIVGDLTTEDNLAAATAALESLADYPTPAHEAMLFRIAVEAEQLVDAKEPDISPEVLCRHAITLLAERGSSAVRAQAAEYLLHNNPPPEVRRGLETIHSDLSLENFEAHLALYMEAGDPKPTRQVLTRHFASSSSSALEHLLGLRPHTDPQRSSWSRKAAQLLWERNFALVVEGRLNRLESWAADPTLLSLALSLPSDTMRAAIADRLDVQWAQGPSASTSEHIPNELIIEPGVLVLLRMLLEKRTDTHRLPSLVSLRSQRTGRGRSGRADPAAVRQRQQWEIQNAWAEFAGDLAADWCLRCRTAAHDQDAIERARGRTIDWTEGISDLAVTPHSTEKITLTHFARWLEAPSKPFRPNGFDPLRVDYVRIEERTRPNRLLAYYDRALPGHIQRAIEGGICFEGLLDKGKPGFLCSADVRITRAAPEMHGLPEQDQDLVVEILIVEIRDPSLRSSNDENAD